MNNDKLEGSMKDAAGKVQRKVGEATGNTSQEVRGAAKQVEGKAQKGVGEARDTLERERDRDATDRDPPHDRARPDGSV
jgi:uncharacterized protein YjbJ (UPF0337 family)